MYIYTKYIYIYTKYNILNIYIFIYIRRKESKSILNQRIEDYSEILWDKKNNCLLSYIYMYIYKLIITNK